MQSPNRSGIKLNTNPEQTNATGIQQNKLEFYNIANPVHKKRIE